MTRTAIIAGTGALPLLLADAMDEEPLFAELESSPAELGGRPSLRFRAERLAPFLDALLAQGVTRVAFAGAMRRPRLEPDLFDPRTAMLAPQLAEAMSSGDDLALRAIIGIFEDWGLEVVGAAELAPALVPAEGVLAGVMSDADRADAARAAEIVGRLGALDIGQGAVVAQGLCLALEALPGTDAMLDALAAQGVAGLLPDPKGARGLLYKAPKAGQDRRVDLPAIGPQTIRRAAAAGLAGVAWQAGGALLLGRKETVRAAEASGLFLWSRP